MICAGIVAKCSKPECIATFLGFGFLTGFGLGFLPPASEAGNEPREMTVTGLVPLPPALRHRLALAAFGAGLCAALAVHLLVHPHGDALPHRDALLHHFLHGQVPLSSPCCSA